MPQLVLIGLGAGAAAALLFASVASGSPLALLLSQLSPLPIMIAGLGWSHWAALIAALAASAGLGIAFQPSFFVVFVFGIGLPAWLLAYLALLARPAERPTADGLEWYPVGHLVVWSAIVSSIIVMAAILYTSPDVETFRATLRKVIERIALQPNRTPVNARDLDRFINLMVASLPGAAVVMNTLTMIVNLWLATRVVKVSGRLRRPAADIPGMRFPSYAPLLLAAAVALSFMPGMPGIAGGLCASGMLFAYALLGLAVLHKITMGLDSRVFLLGGAYATLLLVWPVLAFSMLGLADTAVDIRGRVARRRGPPPPTRT